MFRDKSILVACKPYGVLSEADGHKPNMPSLLQDALGCDTIYPVHRLDRTTQGVMVYALTESAARRLSAMIQQGRVEKTYLAVVEGVPEQARGEYADLLYFDRRKNKSYVVKRERKGVKQARLQYEVLQTIEHEGQWLSLLKIQLLTGRTHQIRVQFASRQIPLVGDRRYGCHIPADHIQLCAARLSFSHPFTGEEMRFSYDPTDEFYRLFKP
ncbi:RluA family pseudouridine synthase [uncultured Ruminococcus sp.]|uniref:RluA family pseudouridine synthase n=1 Tax=uncultured Ruminococcus sp. TaxID=165186 RepID=UPI00292F9389|nr:RluA family pseudouridine synthase [uncultured Ruminococcus sp.]